MKGCRAAETGWQWCRVFSSRLTRIASMSTTRGGHPRSARRSQAKRCLKSTSIGRGISLDVGRRIGKLSASIKDMNATETIRYLERAWKQSLPIFHGPPGADAPPLRRLLLPQGELAQLHDTGEPIQYIAYIQLKEGVARGNHYHDFKQEYVYLLEGEAILDLEDIQTKARDSIPVKAGDLAFLPTRIAHAIRVLKSGHAL